MSGRSQEAAEAVLEVPAVAVMCMAEIMAAGPVLTVLSVKPASALSA